jgi:hypothetical protein
VGAVAADRLAALPACDPCFVRGKFVSGPFRMSGFSAFACDFTLFGRIHRRKTALARIRHEVSPLELKIDTAKTAYELR